MFFYFVLLIYISELRTKIHKKIEDKNKRNKTNSNAYLNLHAKKK